MSPGLSVEVVSVTPTWESTGHWFGGELGDVALGGGVGVADQTGGEVDGDVFGVLQPQGLGGSCWRLPTSKGEGDIGVGAGLGGGGEGVEEMNRIAGMLRR